LLRHTREPEAISADQLDAIWSQIEAEVAPAGEPWWRKAWVWWSVPALAAAAVLFVVVVDPASEADSVAWSDSAPHADERVQQAESPSPASPSEAGVAESEEAESKSKSDTSDRERKSGAASATRGIAADAVASRDDQQAPFKNSFARLAPHGRAAIGVSVDQSRDELRARLLAKARGGG
jgi:hypothetical protein